VRLPMRLQCGAKYRWWNSGGWLAIAPSSVTFEFGHERSVLPLPKGVLHAQPPVTLVTARLLPPGLNSGLILDDGATSVCVLTWWGVRRRVRAGLAAADIAVVDVRTWFTVGTGLAARRNSGR
jgi:hypothetical protein